MSDLALYPASLPCGFCDASTALERDQLASLSVGFGCCPDCRRLVLSVAGPSEAIRDFLDWAESIDFPSEQDVSLQRFFESQASGYQGSRL